MADAWYQDLQTDAGLIISSRVRLARNIKKYPFRSKISKEQAKQVVEETAAAAPTQFKNINPADYNYIDLGMFQEKHIISREFTKGSIPKGLLLQDNFNASIMVNEEDHIRIQTVSPGDDITASWDMANAIDDAIEESVDFAFDSDFGYLTACPTNVGTGMRASFMIHLPMLEKTGQLKNLLPEISRRGIAIRGIYGEGSGSMGGIYQISNQMTLGKSERDIIEGLQNVTKSVIEKELDLRNKTLETHRLDVENNVYRSYGILTHSRKVTAKEAMALLSEIKLGYAAQVLDLPKPNKSLYQIMMEIQPGHLKRAAGIDLDENKLAIARAEYLRNSF